MSSTDIQPLDAELFPQLSERQRRTIPIVLAAPSITAGLQAAEVPRPTWYRWRREGAFKKALDDCQFEVFREALDDLRRGSRYAVNTLLGLLTSKSESIKLQAAREILSATFKAVELLDQESRIRQLEEITDILLPKDTGR